MPFIAGADPDFSLVVVIQDVQNADSTRNLVCQPKRTGEDRSSIPALGWCRMIGGL
jgi:hypothetical protein